METTIGAGDRKLRKRRHMISRRAGSPRRALLPEKALQPQTRLSRTTLPSSSSRIRSINLQCTYNRGALNCAAHNHNLHIAAHRSGSKYG